MSVEFSDTRLIVPDFRSKGTGLYHNVQKLNLNKPQDLFDIRFFRQNPQPFYSVSKEIQADHCRPTFTHLFVASLHEKGLLRMLFTQNIDALERKAGIPSEKLVEAHGSYATQSCIDCCNQYPDELMRQHVDVGKVPICLRRRCDGLIKPDIVFFGEGLPKSFHENRNLVRKADLAIVIGSSLKVSPFGCLPADVPTNVPRLLLNNELVGDFCRRPDDVHVKGPCDDGARALARELGWHDEIDAKWRSLAGEEEATRQLQRNAESLAQMVSLEVGSPDDSDHSEKKEEDEAVTQLANSIEATHVSPVRAVRPPVTLENSTEVEEFRPAQAASGPIAHHEEVASNTIQSEAPKPEKREQASPTCSQVDANSHQNLSGSLTTAPQVPDSKAPVSDKMVSKPATPASSTFLAAVPPSAQASQAQSPIPMAALLSSQVATEGRDAPET